MLNLSTQQKNLHQPHANKIEKAVGAEVILLVASTMTGLNFPCDANAFPTVLSRDLQLPGMRQNWNEDVLLLSTPTVRATTCGVGGHTSNCRLAGSKEGGRQNLISKKKHVDNSTSRGFHAHAVSLLELARGQT